MLRYLFLFLLLIPTLVNGQSFTSTGNEKIVIGTNTIVSSVGGFNMAGTGTNVLSLPLGTSPYDISPASKRVLLTNGNAEYEITNVASNQTANFFIDIPYATGVALTDISIVNKSATSNYQVSVAQAAHTAYTAIPVEWEITRTGATATDVNDLIFSWGNALEPSEILDKRLFVFNTTSLSWTLLPLEKTSVDEVNNKLTFTGYEGALTQSKFMIAESSFNANIFSLTVSPGTLVPVFAPATLKYDVTVSSTTSSFSITPTLGIAGATLTINGVAHTSGTVYTSPLVTNTTIFKLNVTSTNGLATQEYIIRVFKNLTTIPAPEKNWVDLFKGANFDPNNDQQATADTDIVGDADNPLVQAQQNFVSINGTLEKVYYFRARLANKISNNGTAPGTSFYYGLDVTNDQKINLVVEANVKASTPYVAFHKHDPAKDGSGPSQTSWMNSTTNINIERKLTATQSKITYYPTVLDASTTKLDMDAPVGGANTGNDTWLEFAFSESSFRSFTTDALGTPKNGDEVYGLVAFTSTSQTANGDIGGINDKTADLSKSWAQLGVILTASLDDVTDPVYKDPLTVDVINTKSTNSNASVYGVWNGNLYPNSTLTVNVYNLDNTTIKQTFTYNNATKATTVNPATPAGVISTTGLSWYIDVTDYASGNYKVEAIMSDNSVMPNSDTEIGYLLITSVKVYELLTDDTTPTISGESDQAPGATVTIELYDATGTVKIKTYTTTTTADGKWSFTIPDADALTIGNYELNAKVVVGGSTSTDEILLKIVDSPKVEITSTLTHIYGSTVLSGTSDQLAGRTIDLVLTNELGEEYVYAVQTTTGGNWSFDLSTLPVAQYQIYVSVEDPNGIRVSDEGVLVVNKKSLTIEADDKTKRFGEADPILTVTYTGFATGEDASFLGGTISLTRESGETLGNYVISVGGLTSNNYTITFDPGTLAITKRLINSPNVELAALPDVVYQGADFTPTMKVYDGGTLVLAENYTVEYTNNRNVGTATVKVVGANNYQGEKSITFAISRAPLTVKADDKTKVFGAADPALTVTYTGLVGSDVTGLTLSSSISRATGESVGNYVITPSNTVISPNVSLTNYTVSYQTGSFSITGKSISASDGSPAVGISIADIANLPYTGLAQSPALTITDGSTPLVLGTDFTASYSNNINSGTATITITGIGNYSGVTTKTFAIVPVTLTITADNISKTFGATDPALTLSFNGFVNSETEAVLGGTLSLSRTAGELINPTTPYAITVGGYTSSNYTITFVPGVFSINSKLLSSADITLSTISNVVYNGDPQVLKPIVYDKGVVLTETTDYTITHSSNTTDVGTVTVTLTGAGGYSGTKTTTYEITQAPLTIKADDQSKVFGAVDPSLTVTYTGFVDSETIADLAGSLSVSRTATENVGVHTNSITASGYTSTNYNISYQTGTFTITARTINAAEITIDPVSAVTYKGTAYTPTVIVKDGTTTLASPASYTLTYDDNIDAGTATITITGAGNYNGTRTVTFVINKAPLTVTAEAKSKTFGSVDPGNSVVISGFVNSQTNADLNGTLGFTRAPGEAVGTYVITTSGYLSDNYTITYVPADLTINTKALSTANNISIAPIADVVYKGTVYEILPVVKDGNTLLVKDTDYNLTYLNHTNAGTATVTVTGKTPGNYSGSMSLDFTITKAPLTITADKITKTFGAADPSMTVTYTGFVNQENETSLNISQIPTRLTGESVGTYTITPSTVTLTNYLVTNQTGTLSITAKSISGVTIGAIDAVNYTGSAHTPTPSVSDGATLLTTTDDYTLSYSENINAGTATVIITGKGNYSGTATKTFTINKVALTITAEAKSKTFGATDPDFTVTYAGFVGSPVDDKDDLNGALSFSRASGEAVGTYAITPAGLSSNNYTITYATALLTISAKDINTATDITIAAIPDVVYKGSAYTPLPIVKDGNTLLEEGLSKDYTLTYAANTAAGTATVTVTGRGNYTGTKTVNFTISKAPLTITADNKTKVTGQADPSFTVSYSGFVGGETASVLTGTLTFSRTSGETKGDYAIIPVGYADPQTNYTITYVPGVLTISGTDIGGSLVTAAAITDLTYTGSAQTPSPVLTDIFLDPNEVLVLGTDYTLTYSNNTDAGTASILVTGKGEYFGTRIITFKILPKTLKVTADNQTKVYGQVDPVFTYAIDGYISGESLTVTGSLFRTVGESVASSPYAINLGNLAISDKTDGATTYKASNYKLELATGKNLTITKAPLTVIVNDDAKFVGQDDLSGYAGVSYSGFVFGENASTAGITGLTITRSNFSNNGADVYPGVLSASGASAANYSFTYPETSRGKYTIVAADQLLVQLGNISIIYGTAPTYTVASAKYAKLRPSTTDQYDITDLTNSTFVTNGTTVTVNEVVNSVSTTTATFTIEPQTPSNSTSGNLKVGTYVIVPGVVTESSTNFNNTIVLTGTLAVTQKALTAEVSGGTSKVYDGMFPMEVLSLGISSSTPLYSNTTVTPNLIDQVTPSGTGVYTTKDVGSSDYTVSNMSLSGADAANYFIAGGASATIAGTGGTITARPLTITPIPNQSKIFGASDPTLLYTYANNVDGETPAFTGVLSRASGETKRGYNIVVGDLALVDNSAFKAANYSLNFTPNVQFNITNNNLSTSGFSVDAISSLVYNGANQEPTVVINDLSTNPITQLSSSTDYTLSYSNNINVGTATVTITGAGNYTGTRIVTFQITKAPLTITASAASKTFGAVEPTSFAVTYAGFVGNPIETEAVITKPSTLATRVSGEDIGSYVISPTSSFGSSNYNITYATGLFTIDKKSITGDANITLSTISDQVYKGFGHTPSLTVTDISFDPDKVLVLGTDYTLSYTDNINVGTATVTVTGIGNYSGTKSTTFAITQKTLTIKAEDKTKVFGEANPTFTATYTGFVNGETPAVLTGTQTITVAGTGTAGSHIITAVGFTSSNYAIDYQTGTLIISTKDIASADISIDPLASMVYTGANQTPLPVVKEGANTFNLTSDYTITSYVNNKDVGTATITITGAGNYSGTRTVTFQITKAPLTITATNASKGFGATEPSSFAVSYSGFKASETETNVAALTTLAISRESGENVGTYVITPSAAAYANYTVSFVNGLFTIGAKNFSSTDIAIASIADVVYQGFAHTPSPVVTDNSTTLTEGTHYTVSYTKNLNVGAATVTVTGKGNYTGTLTKNFNITTKALSITADAKTITFGEASPVLTVTYNGFVSGESSSALAGTLAVSRGTEVNVGVYTNSIVANGFTSNNYSITYHRGTFTILAKTISASDITVSSIADIIYTGTAHSPEPIVKDGATTLIKNTDYTLSYSADQSNVCQVTVTITGIGNYSGTRTVTFNITRAALTITAENKTKEFGSANPTFTATYAGFVNGQTAASLSITPTLSTTATVSSAVGIYPITPSGVSLDNYTVSYVPGNLAITARAINASGITIDAIPSVNYTGTAHTPLPVVKDGSTTLTKDTDYILSYGANVNAGTVTITITGKGNYSGTNSTTFTITPIPLTITAGDKSKVYGEIDPSLTVTYLGFVTGDNEADLDGTLAINRAAGETPNTYTITPSGSTSGNYTISFATGTFTITAKTMGSADITVDPIADLTYTGLAQTPSIVVKDKGVVLESPRDYTFEYTDHTNAGTATVTIKGTGNYSGTKTVNFTIKKKALTITADDKQKIFGTVDPGLTASYDGFVQGQTVTNLTGTLGLSRTSGEAFGIYPITASGVSSTNYEITFVKGTFSISSKLISSTDITATLSATYPYTGLAQVPEPVIKDGPSKTLVRGVDYLLTFNNNTNVGTATILVAGIGDYSGDRTLTFGITKAPLVVTANDKTKVFGTADPVFDVSYSGFVNSQTASVLQGALVISRVLGENVGDYVISSTGLTSTNYEIQFAPGTLTIGAKSFADSDVTIDPIASLEYNGAQQTPAPVIKYGTVLLVNGTDYDLCYSNNKNVGEATIIATGKGNYAGDQSEDFTITKANLVIKALDQTVIYGTLPTTVTANGLYSITGLMGTDMEAMAITAGTVGFTTDFEATTSAGNTKNLLPDLSSLVSGNYTFIAQNGTVSVTKAPSTLVATGDVQYVFDKTAQGPSTSTLVGSSETVTYTYEGTGTTIYEASSQKPTQAGTYQVTAAVEADSNFEGITSAPLAFEIARKSLDTDIADFTIDAILDVIYSGLAQEPQPSILYGDVRLFNDFDYTLSYTENVDAGTATVRVTGIKNYVGEISRTFIIQKANLTLRMDGQVVRYGSEPTAIIAAATFTYDGFVPGDDANDVTGTIDFETDFTNTTPAGESRNVTANLTSLSAANYNLYQASGLVEVIKALSTIDASGDIEFTYTGAPQGPAGSTVVGSSGNVIYTYTSVDPTVYEASTDLPVDAGTYEMVAEVLTDSNYEGKLSTPYAFEILPKSLRTLNDITVDSIPSLVYDGSEQEPKPVIKDGLVTLTEGIDYDLIYDDNKDAGISTITIEGKGNYSNSIQTQFEIQKRKLIITPTEGLGKERLSEDPVLTFELDAPLEEGDVFAGDLVRESGEENGTYLISLGTLDAGPNYQIEFVESEFTIVDTTSPSIILTGSDESFDQDNKSNQMIYEVSLIEGDQPLDSFNADEDVVWTLEPSGDTDQVSLFELIENEDGTISVRFKDESKPGEFQVNLCSTDPSGNKACLTIVIKVRVKTIILNLVIDENNEEELTKDPTTNLAFIEKVIPEGEQRVASFTTDNDLVWGLESFGDRDDTGLFELVFDTEDGNSLPTGKILNLRISDSFIKRVSVVFKDKSIAGFYQVKLSARDLFGNESFVVIKVTVLADVLAVLTIENQVDIPWGSSMVIKAQQQVLTSDGESPFVDVQLNETPLNRFARGNYRLTGELLLPDYLKNPSDLKADIIVRVLPKPAPIDLTLSKNEFAADLVKEFLFVGDFAVMDPVDDIHEVELYNDGYDNKYFEIKDKVLFWSSADPGAGKTKFTILVRVTDRDGNTLDKFFEITRTRPSVSELEIYNTFTPNGDGINDDWGVPGIRFYRGARVEVFDGGGIRMFYTEDAKVRWDGTHKGKAMPVGSYYWIIEVDETGEMRKGIVNLLRN